MFDESNFVIKIRTHACRFFQMTPYKHTALVCTEFLKLTLNTASSIKQKNSSTWNCGIGIRRSVLQCHLNIKSVKKLY